MDRIVFHHRVGVLCVRRRGPYAAASRAEAESHASVVVARELSKIDAFLSSAASDVGAAGVTIAHHVGAPGGGSLGFVADALAWVARHEVMRNYYVRRGLAAAGAMLMIAFLVATTVVEKQEDVFNAVDQGALHAAVTDGTAAPV